MRRITSLLIAAIIVCSISSCRRIPLYDPVSSVYLRLDIKLNTDVVLNDDIDIEGNAELKEKVHGKMPETVRACFYSTETHKLVVEEFLPPEGGFVDIAAGTYDIIVYSLGNEVTRTDGTDTRAGSHALTSETGATVRITYDADDTKGLEDYKAIHEPDHIFVGTKENAEVPVHAEHDETVIIDIRMTTLLDTYSLEVKYVEGAGRIQKADVYITGQAPSRFMWDRRFPSTPCALYFQSNVDEKKGNLYTVFNTFGKFPNAHNDVYLNVLVTDIQGGRHQWVYDVTDQFDDPDNHTHQIIIDDPIKIPEDEGGFTHDVTDWKDEAIYVPL